MQKPTIHLNGTSAEALLRGYAEARVALALAMEALRDCAPNGRDYYPQLPGAIIAATREHGSRVEKLKSVLDDISELQEHVQGAIDERKMQREAQRMHARTDREEADNPATPR